jgi:hypothetical protein
MHHAKAPWNFSAAQIQQFMSDWREPVYELHDKDKKIIGWLYDNSDAESHNTLRLVLAAPDLLQAVAMLLEAEDDTSDLAPAMLKEAIDDLREAYTKATGIPYEEQKEAA